MRITLEKNSWHFRYYAWILDTQSAPKSLCPYFWSLVTFIVFSPIILIIKFLMWRSEISDEKRIKEMEERAKKITDWDEFYKAETEKLEKKSKRAEKTGKILFATIILAIAVLGIVGLFYAVQKHGWIAILINIGIALGLGIFISLIIMGIAHGIPKLFTWISELSIVKMIGGMIRASYEKACPIIEWQGISNEKTN